MAFQAYSACLHIPVCNRIRGLKDWSEILRTLPRSLINFEYNPNVAPTEQVPAFLAKRGKPFAAKMARFGINLASHGGRKRPPTRAPNDARTHLSLNKDCPRPRRVQPPSASNIQAILLCSQRYRHPHYLNNVSLVT
jgi:hypothetical protein